jgi:hypothetical protein
MWIGVMELRKIGFLLLSLIFDSNSVKTMGKQAENAI